MLSKPDTSRRESLNLVIRWNKVLKKCVVFFNFLPNCRVFFVHMFIENLKSDDFQRKQKLIFLNNMKIIFFFDKFMLFVFIFMI